MKLRKCGFFSDKGGAGLFTWLSLLLAFFPSLLLAAPMQDVMRIQRAEFIVSDAATMPANDAGWQAVALPHRAPKLADRDLVGYWYKATFTVSGTRQPLWLFFPKLRSGGAIFVNGIQIDDIRSADRQYQVRWFQPHMVFLPPLSLREGRNDIAVRFAIREPLTGFGEITIGPEKPIRATFDQLQFWENTSTEVSSIVCLLVGAFVLALWLRRRQEKLYGVFGICALCWGLRAIIFRMPVVPMDYWVLWRFFYYLTTAGFVACIIIFLLRFSGYIKPALNRFLLAYWLIGCFSFLLIGAPARLFMDAYWITAFNPFTVFAVIRLAIFVFRERTPSGIAMMAAILFVTGLALHDQAVQFGLFHLQDIYLLHLGIPAFLLVMGCVLLERFIDSLKRLDSVNEQLALRVADREKELGDSYEKLRKLERDRAATEERQRIMQDMHDGVGSQLLSTLMMVQRGAATQSDMATLLQECIDDMRLAIDSLSPNDPDLLPVLGNFRFRMESRFKSMGLTLQWHNHHMPDTLEILPHAGLQVLRILQEALTNVLKHAQATAVEVNVNFLPNLLRIRIVDDGVGFDPADKHVGKGLTNMRVRAQKIGAAFEIEHLSPGTAVRLDIQHAS